jgi:hypothetical protein
MTASRQMIAGGNHNSFAIDGCLQRLDTRGINAIIIG